MDGDERLNAGRRMNKKKKFVQEGVFKAELRSFLERSLAEQGFSGIDVLATNTMTTVNVYASRADLVVGENEFRQRELSSLIRKRFNYSRDSFDLFAKKVVNKGLSAAVQAESLKFSLASGLPVRMAANRVIRFVMRDGAKGIEVAVSGKLRLSGYFLGLPRPRLPLVAAAWLTSLEVLGSGASGSPRSAVLVDTPLYGPLWLPRLRARPLPRTLAAGVSAPADVSRWLAAGVSARADVLE